jgi:hypothetical protein
MDLRAILATVPKGDIFELALMNGMFGVLKKFVSDKIPTERYDLFVFEENEHEVFKNW